MDTNFLIAQSTLSEFVDVFVYTFSSGKKRFRFVRCQPREYWLFGIFSSTSLVGTELKMRSHSQLAPFVGRYNLPFSE